jgi:hypothetical protein
MIKHFLMHNVPCQKVSLKLEEFYQTSDLKFDAWASKPV